ncbi:HAD hydrolase family protein [Helicobacter turcicus]|uniref:HAD hydrolase family protein n=1 Tax=Helicobacter turcicus TaxID=2867412 RepID=A0ABS7JMH5_9HELI|nr:HAD hydrolase family protein [Helicobacter turcicus]MBX7490604.1 HAD hydrolase family protein [Helicobacter turcicus]MBX7545488.1 HAD hydrolase family protein [Helicobacter turcicus]
MKNIIIDLDGTLTIESDDSYSNKTPNTQVIRKLREYKEMGFNITISTSRGMRTHNGNIGQINIHTLPNILEWLNKHNVPYDEVIVGKPWCGFDGFYIDDKAIRPSEFCSMRYENILELLKQEKQKNIGE